MPKSSSPLHSPVVHATPRNRALDLGGRSGFDRFIGHDERRAQYYPGPPINYSSQAGAPIDATDDSRYHDRVEPADVPAAARAGFALKPYSAK